MSIRRIRSPARTSAVALGVVALAAGCGGAPRTSPSVPPSRGEALFVQQCGACHRLAAAGTEGVAAADLDKVKPSLALVLRMIATPPETMPSNLVAGKDAQLVAAYVVANAGR